MSELERKIRHYAQCYYEGHPEISDAEFDKLVEELQCTEPDNIILGMTGWGYTPEAGKKIKHPYGNMYSISRKPRSLSGIPDTFDRVRLTPKYDGLSCAVYFSSGKIIAAATRGNGDIGIDITDKISRILHQVQAYGFTGGIRGELVMSRKNWVIYKESHPEAKNPRNVVAGIINRDEIGEDIQYIDFCPYKYIADESMLDFNGTPYVISSIMNEISEMLQMPITQVLCRRSELTEEYLRELYETYNEEYPCDGVVITNVTACVRKGIIEYDEVAYKFNTDTEVTTVTGIDWNRTRTGKLIPTIVVEPIDLDGSTIRRCAGFNAKFILESKITKGTKIRIRRSGGVIPDITAVFSEEKQKWIEV